MYSKPEVRIVQNQQETTSSSEVTSSEAAALLAKYGYSQPPFQPQPAFRQPNDGDLTMEQIEQKLRHEAQMRRLQSEQIANRPKALTFDSHNIQYGDTSYRDLGIDGQNIGIQVQVVSDIPIRY